MWWFGLPKILACFNSNLRTWGVVTSPLLSLATQKSVELQVPMSEFNQDQERRLQPALTRTHFSAGRITALLLKPSRNLSAMPQRYRESFLRFCPVAHGVRKLALQFRAMLR